MISILSNFWQRTGTRGQTAQHDVGCKPTLTTTVAALDHSTTVGQNLESVNMSNQRGGLRVANPQGLKKLFFLCFLFWGWMYSVASTTITYLGSYPSNGSSVGSLDNIELEFDLSGIDADSPESEGEWGICYYGNYSKLRPKNACAATLYKGDNETGEVLERLSTSYSATDANWEPSNKLIISYPTIEVEENQLYTIVVTYQVYANKKNCNYDEGRIKLLDNPIVLTFYGGSVVKKSINIESTSLTDNEENLPELVKIYFNNDINVLPEASVIVKEGDALIASSKYINKSISEPNCIEVEFDSQKLYASHNYEMIVCAGSVSIADDISNTNAELNVNFEGTSYNMFGYSRVIPRPGVATLLDEIQIIFDFPAGYGFVYVDNDATYPLTVYKGEAVEANLLGTVKDDGVTSDSKGLIYHPDFDWEAGQTYTFVLDEDVVKAYEIGATKPTYLKDYKCERIEIAFNTPAVEDIPKVTVASAAASEPLDKLSTLGFSIPLTKYEFNDTEYKVTTLGSYVEVPLYEVASNGAEKKIGTYFFDVRTTTDGSSILNFQGSNTGAPMDFALDNDKDYRFDFPANYVGANQKLLKKYSGNEPFSFVIKGTSATSFDITYQIIDGGSMTTTVAKGSTPTFKVVAPQDWKVESVKFNGEEVELVNDEYTTPAIEADATVEVEYAYAEEIQFLDLVSSIEDIDVDGSNYSVGKDGEYVVVNNVAKGDVITVYTVGGMQVANHIANNDIVKIQLPAGIYIIRVNNVTFKIQH